MKASLTRTAMLLGEAGLKKLNESTVAIIGLGGVGGHCAEALARAGVGTLYLIDGDVVDESNINRQLIATKHTIGIPKTAAMRARIEDISDCTVHTKQIFLLEDNVSEALPAELSFIVDAVDTVAAKLALARFAQAHAIPIISSMGAGNRLDPGAFYITDIFRTEGCPLARAMRQGCRRYGIHALTVVASHETPRTCNGRTPGSISFVPAAAGLMLAGHVVRALSGCAKD